MVSLEKFVFLCFIAHLLLFLHPQPEEPSGPTQM